MLILKLPARASMAATVPLAMSLPALAVMFGGRFGSWASGALVVAGLVLIAGMAALAARTADHDAAERARRDAAVLDALEPLAGLSR
ncbi:hypothetical protein WDV06_10955 [Streptomyces racemochromogenes]|uniref:Uncharacterized protein n=1 Tax=Streptomyces racemochromogenes TaxID=67353 RepID=A0ABW7PBR8_9ACTN